MSLPTSQKQWLIQGTGQGFDSLVYQDAPIPKLGADDVLVQFQGASLNFRDLLIPQGKYIFPLQLPIVAGSDGAGTVLAVGSNVTEWAAGDRVLPLFNQGHQKGAIDTAAAGTGLGGCVDGTLRRYGVFGRTGVVRMPANLDFVEAATLGCAALTAWNAFYGLKKLAKGETVLVLGTGGVALFGLQVSNVVFQFAKAAGATVIATTSSAEKADVLKKLGADHVINYREDPNWGETARKLTPNGEGVDHIIEIGGEGTMTQSLNAIKMEGIISVIGVISGTPPKDNIIEALSRLCTVRGVYVGSRELFEEMVQAIEKHDLHPVLDEKRFTLETAKEAYEYMWAQKHFGKIGIKIE
ncbi:alcohol dehydrogenase-like protein [Chaetomium fimeti]|uniref:Alcohol dehydrogenase-like protein n=1 Tax=Chaetomium fimeti TaxID=1854472 RepID=A0AAE0H758_9PEZI|nr:alcohol dehydrogenase-like protein [Chaetomium fimeti]